MHAVRNLLIPWSWDRIRFVDDTLSLIHVPNLEPFLSIENMAHPTRCFMTGDTRLAMTGAAIWHNYPVDN
jgi:hypothetical protein